MLENIISWAISWYLWDKIWDFFDKYKWKKYKKDFFDEKFNTMLDNLTEKYEKKFLDILLYQQRILLDALISQHKNLFWDNKEAFKNHLNKFFEKELEKSWLKNKIENFLDKYIEEVCKFYDTWNVNCKWLKSIANDLLWFVSDKIDWAFEWMEDKVYNDIFSLLKLWYWMSNKEANEITEINKNAWFFFYQKELKPVFLDFVNELLSKSLELIDCKFDFKQRSVNDSKTTQTIPNWWKKVKLGEVATFEYWYTQSANEKKIWPKFLRITDISKDNLDWDSVPYCEISHSNFEKYKLKNWDIVVARTWATAWYAKYIKNPPKSVFAGYLIRIKPSKNLVRNDFLWPLIESNIFKEFIKKHIQGAAQPQANVPVIREFEFLLPPLPIQRKVASILSAYDDLIENNNKRIKTLETMAKAIFDDMMKQAEEKGELEEVKLTDFCEVKYWKNLPKSKLISDWKYPVYGASKVIWYYNEYNVEDRTLIVWCRWTVWEVNITRPKSFVTNNSFALKCENYKKWYAYFYLKKRGFKDIVWWVAQPQITLSWMETIKIKTPEIEILKDFYNKVNPIFELIFNLQLQNQNLKQTRDLLIPRLVSGKLDVEKVEVI